MTAPERPTAHTRRAHRDACVDPVFDWDNRQDFEFASRGLIHRPDDPAITDADGVVAWHHEAFSLRSTHHRVQIPGYTREVGPPEHGAALHVACRARGGDLPERFPPTGPQGGIYLDNHPEDPGVYTVLHPMHWILGLSGHDEERWPVQVRIGVGETMTSDLVRARIDYSAPRPGLDIALPVPAILEAILADGPIEVAAQGDGMRLSARFSASANARRVPSRSMRDTRHRSLSYTIDNATAPKNENACTCPSTHASAVAARYARTYDASLCGRSKAKKCTFCLTPAMTAHASPKSACAGPGGCVSGTNISRRWRRCSRT